MADPDSVTNSFELPELLVLATHNPKKCQELRQLLSPLGVELRSLAEFDKSQEVEETGTTFIENARLKAQQQAQFLGRWAIGEDSGLCVPFLDNAPGVYSARYAGPHATDELNNDKLLQALESASSEQRDAYYVCTLVLSDPQGTVRLESHGRCWGRITKQRRGTAGFGYDPLFEIREYHHTFGELGPSVKSILSHRARALETFVNQLRAMT